MSPEKRISLGEKVRKATKGFLSRADYVLQGRSPEEDARIIKIAMNPSSISYKDRACFMSEQVIKCLSYPGGSALLAMLTEQQLSSLPQDQFDKRVVEDAMFKAKKWELIAKGQRPRL